MAELIILVSGAPNPMDTAPPEQFAMGFHDRRPATRDRPNAVAAGPERPLPLAGLVRQG